jgi:hypothetical protein
VSSENIMMRKKKIQSTQGLKEKKQQSGFKFVVTSSSQANLGKLEIEQRR